MKMLKIENQYPNARIVYIDLEFARIGDIDTMNEKYFVDLSFQLTWTDNCIIDKYNKDVHWNPQIYVENIFTKPEETIEYELKRDYTGLTCVIEKHKLKGYLWERLELKNFPHDVQELSVTFASKLDLSKLKIIARNYTLGNMIKNTFTEQQKWKLLDLIECSQLASYDIDEESTDEKQVFVNIPKLSFKCYACRKSFYYYANAYFLIFLITLTSLSIFSMDCKLPQNRLQTTTIILLTSVSFKWVINRSLPTVSYTTTLDEYSILCILFLCLLCAWHSIVGTFWSKDYASEIDKWMLLAFSCIFILIHINIFIKAIKSKLYIRKLKTKKT